MGKLMGLGLALAGAAVGVVGAIAAANWHHSKVEQPSTSRAATASLPTAEQQLSQIEARLRQLESQQKAPLPATPAPAPAAQAEAPAGEEPTPEVRSAAFWEKVRASVDAHNAELRDPSFAAKATDLLSSDLAALAASNHFKVASLDCRTTTCLAKVEWPSERTAADEYSKLATEPFRVNCGRSVALEEAPLPSGARQAVLLFECEDWRADGEQLFERHALN